MIVRNIQFKLDVPRSRHTDLDATFEEFRQAAQHVADVGWADDPADITVANTPLHHRTYENIRDELGLPASLVQSARDLAANALANCRERLLDGKNASKPEFKGTVVRYNRRTITYHDDHVTLATVQGRVKADLIRPENESGTPFEEYWTDEWERTEATLHKRDDTYYLHVAVRKDATPASNDGPSENGAVLGVDLNVNGYLAVTSTGAFLGSADHLNQKRDEYERRRGRLQRTGTRSAHLTLRSIGGRFARWSEGYLHRVSKAIVHEARNHGCSAIAFENLIHIRKRISSASKFQQWAFRELQRQVEYKAEEDGIAADTVAPQYTSQRCSHSACGFTHQDNRDGDEFECLECGKQLHSDYNAARNIGWRLLQCWRKSGAGRATGQLALKSGMLSVNGEYSSTAPDR